MPGSEKKDLNHQTSPESESSRRATELGPTSNIRAEFSADEDLVVRGKLQGSVDIQNNNLIIEKGAEVDAEIRARNITIKGKVKGNIYASGKVFIEREAQVFGDLTAARISIMEGAKYKGSMKMVSHIQP